MPAAVADPLTEHRDAAGAMARFIMPIMHGYMQFELIAVKAPSMDESSTPSDA